MHIHIIHTHVCTHPSSYFYTLSFSIAHAHMHTHTYTTYLPTALDTFILFAHRTDIRRISLDVEEVVDLILPLANLTGATALDWDSETDRIYWTDLKSNTINAVYANVSLFVLIP